MRIHTARSWDPTYSVSVREGRRRVAVARMTVMKDNRGRRYGFIREVLVDESQRGKGLGTKLSAALLDKGRALGCYKIVLTSGFERDAAHALYLKLGFKKHGYEFRIDLEDGS